MIFAYSGANVDQQYSYAGFLSISKNISQILTLIVLIPFIKINM